jgi:pimeloyl-ACP methyl ester carboxylesterase
MLHHAESGTGPAVVLLHAFPMDATLWAPQRGALAERGFRVITPDLPGFGGSPLSERAPDLDVMADEVADLMAGLGVDEAVVGGLSMGGYVAMAMLRRHRARVSALLLADTRAGADSPEAAANREAVARSVQAAGSTAQLAEMMLPQLLGTTTLRLRPEVVATVGRWIRAQPPAAVAWAQRAMARRPDSTATLADFGGPTLVLHGSEDTLSPAAEAEAMAAATRRGGSPTTVVQVPAAGHLTAVEDPGAVTAALLDWLPQP